MPGNSILWRLDHPIWYLFLLSAVSNSYWRSERWQRQRKPNHKTKKKLSKFVNITKIRRKAFPRRRPFLLHLRWPFQYHEWMRLPDNNKEMVLAGKWKKLWHSQQADIKAFPSLGMLFCVIPWYWRLGIFHQKWKKQTLLQHVDIITISCKRLHQFTAIMVKITAAHLLDWPCKLIFPFPSWSWPFCTDFFCHTTGCLKELLHSGDWNVLAILGQAA